MMAIVVGASDRNPKPLPRPTQIRREEWESPAKLETVATTVVTSKAALMAGQKRASSSSNTSKERRPCQRNRTGQ